MSRVYAASTLLILMLLALGAAAQRPLSAQADTPPTPNPFQLTADVQATQAADQVNVTATARSQAAQFAPTQTADALMQQALTATAFASVPDYGAYDLIDVQTFDLMAGPGRTGAFLAPTGMRFLHFSTDGACIYTLDDTGAFTLDTCYELEDEFNRLFASEEVSWSPDGRYITLPGFATAFQFFEDTDIHLLDTETGGVTTLTEDNFEDAWFFGAEEAQELMVDIVPQWQDDDTLFFLRYGAENPLVGVRIPSLMSIDLGDDEAEQLGILPSTFAVATYTYDIAPDGETIAYNIDARGDVSEQGIWQANLNGRSPRRLYMAETPAELPMHLSYSADQAYLLVTNMVMEPNASAAYVLDTATGRKIMIEETETSGEATRAVIGVGWSPQGSALAYLVRDTLNPDESGLYITDQPGEPGRLILQGAFFPPTCCGRAPIQWASNNIIMLGSGGQRGVHLVQVG